MTTEAIEVEAHEFVPHEPCSGNGNHCTYKDQEGFSCLQPRTAPIHRLVSDTEADTRIVFEHGDTGPCSACGDGDTAMQYHKHGVPPTDTEDVVPELKSCPFCGKESSGQEFGPGAYIAKSSQAEYYTVICSACCSTATCTSRKRAVEKWNTRTSTAAEALRETGRKQWTWKGEKLVLCWCRGSSCTNEPQCAAARAALARWEGKGQS